MEVILRGPDDDVTVAVGDDFMVGVRRCGDGQRRVVMTQLVGTRMGHPLVIATEFEQETIKELQVALGRMLKKLGDK